MHIETLGVKTYYMAVEPAEVERAEDGSGVLTVMNGSTETRLEIGADMMDELPGDVSMVLVTGDAEIAVWVDDNLQIRGRETLVVTEISNRSGDVEDTSYMEEIPF